MNNTLHNYKPSAREYLSKLVKTLELLDLQSVSDVVNVLESALTANGTIYVFGNGGSASTASHMQNDFNRGLSDYSEKKFKFCCLSDNIATITAIANDFSYEDIYYHQLKDRLLPQDLVIAVSGSGNSKNVIKAAKYAISKGNKVIGLTGFDGGELLKIANFNIHVAINDMQVTEDIHLILNHLMMNIFKQEMLKR